MDISATSGSSSLGSMANAASKANFGAQVVSQTLDYMHGGGGSSSSNLMPTDKQSFGAAVVSKTLDYMHGVGGSSSSNLMPTDKKTFGAAVVSKTLGYMNSGKKKSSGMGSMSQMYDLNKSVLGAVMGGKGIGLDTSA